MDIESLWLELYVGRTPNFAIFSKYFSPNGVGSREYINDMADKYAPCTLDIYVSLNEENKVEKVFYYKAKNLYSPI